MCRLSPACFRLEGVRNEVIVFVIVYGLSVTEFVVDKVCRVVYGLCDVLSLFYRTGKDALAYVNDGAENAFVFGGRGRRLRDYCLFVFKRFVLSAYLFPLFRRECYFKSPPVSSRSVAARMTCRVRLNVSIGRPFLS